MENQVLNAKDLPNKKSKRCTKCGLIKNKKEFYIRKERPIGILSKCISCSREARRLYRSKNINKERARQKKYYLEYLKEAKKKDPETKEKWAKYLRTHRAFNPEKAKARWAVSNAKRWKKREFVVLPCRLCGSKKSEAHHEDYLNPLQITWLCHPCHLKLHYESSGKIHAATHSFNRSPVVVAAKPGVQGPSSRRFRRTGAGASNLLDSNKPIKSKRERNACAKGYKTCTRV